MIDIHSHVLFGVDDGSVDLENSLYSLKLLQDAGVTDVFTTSHYIVGEYDLPREEINRKFKELQEAIVREGLTINIYPGAEYYLTDANSKTSNFADYTLGNSKYILVETAMNGFPHNLLETLYQLVVKGFKPILAHPERYSDIISNPKQVEDLIYRNVYMQANAGSFLGYYGKSIAKTVWELFSNGWIHFIASDYHCHSDDYPLARLVDVFSREYPEINLDLYIKENPTKIIANEKIEYLSAGFSHLSQEPESFISRLLSIFKR